MVEYFGKANRPGGQAAKTSASHAENMGSIPVRVTNTKRTLLVGVLFALVMRSAQEPTQNALRFEYGVAYATQSASSSLVSGKCAYIQFTEIPILKVRFNSGMAYRQRWYAPNSIISMTSLRVSFSFPPNKISTVAVSGHRAFAFNIKLF